MTEENFAAAYQIEIERYAEETGRLPVDIPNGEMAAHMGVTLEEIIGAATFCADCGHVIGANPACVHCIPS